MHQANPIFLNWAYEINLTCQSITSVYQKIVNNEANNSNYFQTPDFDFALLKSSKQLGQTPHSVLLDITRS